MVRKVIVSLVLMAGLLSSAAAVTVWLIRHRPEPERTAIGDRAPLVETVTLAPENAREILRGFGAARADRQTTLSAEVSAPVAELVGGLQEGVAVRAGQLLVRLDDREYQQELREAESMIQARAADLAQFAVERRNFTALLEIAESDLALSRDDLERVRALFEDEHAPKKELDDARLSYQASLRAKQMLDNQIALLEPRRLAMEAEAAAARTRAERAELNIERCRIAAPFDGTIVSLAVEVGDKVRAGAEVLRLVNLELIEVPVALPVSVRHRTRTGAAVSLHVESLPEVRWDGAVARIAPVADERTRTFEVYVEVDNRRQTEPLLPGYFVRADVDGPVLAEALVVPREAVVNGCVFVANGNKAHVRHVQVVRYLGDRAVLAGDVRSGDHVIVTNLDTLFDGAAIRQAGPPASTPSAVATDGSAPAARESRASAAGKENAS